MSNDEHNDEHNDEQLLAIARAPNQPGKVQRLVHRLAGKFLTAPTSNINGPVMICGLTLRQFT